MINDPVLKDTVSFLKSLGKYDEIVRNLENNPSDSSYIFEAYFAQVFEKSNLSLEYEKNINPESDKTVDFTYLNLSEDIFGFELNRPEMSNPLKSALTPVEIEKGIKYSEVQLGSGHPVKYLRPEAVTIRLQEKILEKIDKFPSQNENVISTIVIDCSQFHFGHFDYSDVQMVMFGVTQEPLLQEYWEGQPIKGLLDPALNKRGAEQFRSKISSVIFIPKISIELFYKSYIVLNIYRSQKHSEKLWNIVKNNKIFHKMILVKQRKEGDRGTDST